MNTRKIPQIDLKEKIIKKRIVYYVFQKFEKY